ncbi:DMT family transporter [Novosphingobium sp. 1949]|uniref:DMT family transporter n=1 Tax=Novosphingobium organovorum TaxID=2930092 RepID=A0ABT0B922_9SPHN|nr:DMT family transporter [Novosphingobium organovorum]MCJ2181570.1 DMT family transporter [Novosphingobium organovorum]
MSPTIFVIVLCAALLHATWNAMVKGAGDKYVSTAAVVIGQALFALPTLFFVPAPDAASYPLILAGIALHLGYQFFLMAAYKVGDLTQVYPLARGSAPLIVALVSTLFLGVDLAPMQLAAIALIGLGIMSITFVRRADGIHNRRAALLALGTGLFIASYSLVDGYGARHAGTAIGFYGWLTIGNAIAFVAISALRRRDALARVGTQGLPVLVVGGAASYGAYALVIWSFTQAPIALVTALRETSIVFALFIGVFALGEKLNLAKVVSTMATLAGVILLRFSARQGG